MLIVDYLTARGTKTMTEIAPALLGVDYVIFVQYHDLLGGATHCHATLSRYVLTLDYKTHVRDVWLQRTPLPLRF